MELISRLEYACDAKDFIISDCAMLVVLIGVIAVTTASCPCVITFKAGEVGMDGRGRGVFGRTENLRMNKQDLNKRAVFNCSL